MEDVVICDKKSGIFSFQIKKILYNEGEYNLRTGIWRRQEREDGHMEQIGLFLAEKSGLIAVALSGFNLILLTVSLHKIKRNTRQTKAVLGAVEDIRTQQELFAMRDMRKEEKAAVLKETGIQPRAEAQREKLLDAVLEEVFP